MLGTDALVVQGCACTKQLVFLLFCFFGFFFRPSLAASLSPLDEFSFFVLPCFNSMLVSNKKRKDSSNSKEERPGARRRPALGGRKEGRKEREKRGRGRVPEVEVKRKKNKKNSSLSPTLLLFFFSASARVPSKEQRTTRYHGRLQGPSRELSEPESLRAGGALEAPARGRDDGGSLLSLFLISERERERESTCRRRHLCSLCLAFPRLLFAIRARRKPSRARPRRRCLEQLHCRRGRRPSKLRPIIEPPPLCRRRRSLDAPLAQSITDLSCLAPPSNRSPCPNRSRRPILIPIKP